MGIAVGVVLALVALYFWLLGHWFARVVAFLLFVVLFGLIGSAFTGSLGPAATNHGWVGFLIGGVVAWFVSGIPIYYRRWQSSTPEPRPPSAR